MTEETQEADTASKTSGKGTGKKVIDAGRESIRKQRNFVKQRTGERVITFFDAVVAIAITLLMLEIAIPEAESFTTVQLQELFLPFTALFISFLALGQVWYSHVKSFSQVEYSLSNTDILLHLVLMFFIVLFPKTTELISTYPHSVLAITIYIACFLIVVVIAAIINASVHKQQLSIMERAYAKKNLKTTDKASLAMLIKDTYNSSEDFKVLVKSFIKMLKMEGLYALTGFVTTTAAVIFLFINPWLCYICFIIDIVVSVLCYRQVKINYQKMDTASEKCSVSLFSDDDDEEEEEEETV